MSGNVLAIAYLFPPVGGGGVQRTAKFVRYLPEFGWQPLVLTVKDPAYATFDPSLAAELPGDLVVERTAALQPTSLYFQLKRRSNGEDIAPPPPAHNAPPALKTRLLGEIRRGGRSLIEQVMIPDVRSVGCRYALRRAEQIDR
ncbi:hypothetical protein HC928_12230 [bacterium]|nr:hypothetical protein [bacterium]